MPELALGRRLLGVDFALVGVLQALLIPLAVLVALRPVEVGLWEIGLRGPHVRTDALIGLAFALAFAALQFGVLNPATGGAERSDIVVNAAQIGESSLLHGYQGWAGVIDAGFVGGLVLTGLFLWRRAG